jgi:hypothetical protein
MAVVPHNNLDAPLSVQFPNRGHDIFSNQATAKFKSGHWESK